MSLYAFLGATLTAFILTGIVRRFARRARIMDDPRLDPLRKRQSAPVPLLGGVAIIITVLLWNWATLIFPALELFRLPLNHLLGITAAACIILLGGAFDDRRHLSAGRQLIAPILGIVAVIVFGIGVDFVTNPFGGVIPLDQFSLDVPLAGNFNLSFTLWADVFTVAWLLATMYATKLLDGIDGLVTGVGAIGSVIVFFLTLRPEVHQPEVGFLAIVTAGACLGFLIWNWNPAKIYLGESGSLFVGFILGVLAIISGGKVATALLILGLPILDVFFVSLYRLFVLRHDPLTTADRTHLHFRLVDSGWGVRKTVVFLYAVSTIFGIATLFFQGRGKVYVLFGLVAFSVGLVSLLILRARRMNQA